MPNSQGVVDKVESSSISTGFLDFGGTGVYATSDTIYVTKLSSGGGPAVPYPEIKGRLIFQCNKTDITSAIFNTGKRSGWAGGATAIIKTSKGEKVSIKVGDPNVWINIRDLLVKFIPADKLGKK
jgi:hypothetical protein